MEITIVVTEDELVDRLVNRFLSWKLPKEFSPDAGISFYYRTDYDSPYWPTGTNLLTATQAREMVKHMLGVGELIPTADADDTQQSAE